MTKSDFLGYPLSNSTMTSNFDKIKNFKNQHIAKSLKFILGLKFFEKSLLWTIMFGSKSGGFLMDFYTTPYFF